MLKSLNSNRLKDPFYVIFWKNSKCSAPIQVNEGLAWYLGAGIAVRIRVKDALWVFIPALFYLVINAYIFSYVAAYGLNPV
jgi:hypothetical protein